MEPANGPRLPLGLRRPVLEDVGLAAGAVGLLALFGGGALYIVVEPLQAWALRLVGVGALLLLLSLFLAWRPLSGFMRARQGRYGLNTTVMVLALATILVILNTVSAGNPLRIDLTATRQFTLAPQTIQVLEGLSTPVRATGFFTPRLAILEANAVNLLREYEVQSRTFSYEIIDPAVQPSAALQMGVTQGGTVVFSTEDRAAQTAEISERAFTTALLEVTGRELKQVCVLEGHGERSLIDDSEAGFSEAGQGLRRDNYLVDRFNPAVSDPSDLQHCAVLVVAGPTQELTAEEQGLLAAFLADQGKAFFLLDPDTPESFRELLRPWGIDLVLGTIIDPQSRPEATTPVVSRQMIAELTSPTPITEMLDVIFFPEATGVGTHPDPENPEPIDFALPLIRSGPLSWLETASVEDAEYTPEEDLRGPIVLGAMLQGLPEPGETEVTRLVVIGDSDFARNNFLYARSNGDLFLNSVNWLAEQEFLISVRPKPSAYRILFLTDLQWRLILIFSLVLLPLSVGAAGGVAWWLRR